MDTFDSFLEMDSDNLTYPDADAEVTKSRAKKVFSASLQKKFWTLVPTHLWNGKSYNKSIGLL